MKPKLLFISRNYPYSSDGGETMFIKPEIPHLVKYFDVTVAPLFSDGPLTDDISEITVDLSLSEYFTEDRKKVRKLSLALKGLFSKVFYLEIYRSLKSGVLPNVKSIGTYALGYISTVKWLNKENICSAYDLFYTYWSNSITSGLIGECEDKPIVTRAHGYDLYLERQNGYIPGYDFNFNGVKKIFTISEHGSNYLVNYGIARDKIVLSRLGVEVQQKMSKVGDSSFHVLSCSSVVPLKRVDLIFRALKNVAEINPDITLQWIHIGGGQLLSELKSEVKANCPSNLIVEFAGHMNHEKVISYYKNNSIDIFVHASETEGLPVSMQEAISFGVPIIATDVGGVSEIVVSEVGVLVDPENPSQKLADEINSYLNLNKETKTAKKRSAKKRQEKYFNKDRNHDRFARLLESIVNTLNSY